MSDILIRGLELPTAGQQLDFSEGITGKIYARLYPTPDITDYEKDCWHEVIPIPDHGRLIDADVLMEHLVGTHDGWIEYAHTNVAIDDERIVEVQPTVIPASK